MSQENEIFSFFKSGHCLNICIKFATLHIAAVIYNLTVVQVHIDLVSYNIFYWHQLRVILQNVQSHLFYNTSCEAISALTLGFSFTHLANV